jgi:hypothetical protein
MDLGEIGWDGMDWIDLALDRDQWRALVNTVINLLVPQNVYIHVFLTSALVGGEMSASRLGRFTPGKRVHSIHWIGSVDSIIGLDAVETRKLFTYHEIKFRPLSRLACSQSLYRLSYLD